MRLDVRVTGEARVAGSLARMADRSKRPRAALERLLELIREAQETRLGRGQGGMKRLQPATIARKRRQGLSTKPLRGVTGDLLASATARAHPLGIRDVQRDQLRFGSRVRYGRFHQFGIGVEQRRFLNLTPKQRKGPIAETILDYLMGRAVR